ncbi:hypothetical protein Lalb_Chr01g0015391 [Lupinus albus]|uniref:Uncharacterized protein n=1 Tax=Lupinus albus TaxID=3870 RepID=A0A6A4R739_LUPAL|nr:hypothetical protein Lalb_Chr01g0015391 [Lupinus albus]
MCFVPSIKLMENSTSLTRGNSGISPRNTSQNSHTTGMSSTLGFLLPSIDSSNINTAPLP